MAATGYSSSGAMYYHPYPPRIWNNIPLPMASNSRLAVAEYLGGQWLHTPAVKVVRALKGSGLASAIGAGNFLTRKYRQKPITGLKTYGNKIVRIKTPSGGKINLSSSNKAMPYRTRPSYRPSYRRKSYRTRPRRRRYRKKRITPLNISRSKVVRFRLSSSGSLTSNGGTLSYTVMKANSLQDPTGTLSAALPNSIDNWSRFYTRYLVLGSKTTIKIIPTTQTGPIVAGLTLTPSSTALTNFNQYKETPLTRSKILTTQRDMVTLTSKYSGKRFWHLPNIKDDGRQDASLIGTGAIGDCAPADPTNIAYLHLWIQDLAGAHNITVEYQISMEFVVVFSQPPPITSSALP